MRDAGIVVYAGKGSSHSWTWLADLFESENVLNVRFLDSPGFISSIKESPPRKALISGGDGFTIAQALKGKGFAALERWINDGGSYIGICAGAYLPLPSSIPPFSEFNLSATRIENISCDASLAGRGPREAVPYGSCSIVHPIRGPVRLNGKSGTSVTAPLYGGPIFGEPARDEAVMRYDALTPQTEVQIGRSEAESMIIGRPAIIRAMHGKGKLLLFGPHLEHPGFPEANTRFLDLLNLKRAGRTEGSRENGRLADPNLLSSISDLKVAVLGLENRSFTVGHKAWDGGRLLELLSAIEKRVQTLSEGGSERIHSHLRRARDLLVMMKVGNDSDADEVTTLMVEAARYCVDRHFATKREASRKQAGLARAIAG